jgi:pimeloyl-ACP methyl ester carboxylesterase
VDTFSTFDGITLSYRQEGDGPALVLLHGFTSSTEGNWRRPGIWQSLVDVDRRVIGLDARGHGRSDKPHDPRAYENWAMVTDVGVLLDHLDLGSVDLVGYSMGAATAVRFAAQDSRVRRLVLGGIGGDPSTWGSADFLADRAEWRRRIVAGLAAPDLDQISDPLARRVRTVMQQRDNDLEAMTAFLEADRALGGDVDVSRISVPTLVVCGENDVSPQPLAAALPHGHAHVLPGDHESVVSDPELAKVITAFVSEDAETLTSPAAK